MDGMAFTLRTLGSLELRDARGNVVRGAGAQRKPLLILALTAMQPDGITRNRLLRILWPVGDTDRARASLKQHLYALRMATGSPTIIGGAPTLRVDRAVLKVDVLELYEAVANGDLLAAASTVSESLAVPRMRRTLPSRPGSIRNFLRTFPVRGDGGFGTGSPGREEGSEAAPAKIAAGRCRARLRFRHAC